MNNQRKKMKNTMLKPKNAVLQYQGNISKQHKSSNMIMPHFIANINTIMKMPNLLHVGHHNQKLRHYGKSSLLDNHLLHVWNKHQSLQCSQPNTKELQLMTPYNNVVWMLFHWFIWINKNIQLKFHDCN